jgi:hypothetical protein
MQGCQVRWALTGARTDRAGPQVAPGSGCMLGQVGPRSWAGQKERPLSGPFPRLQFRHNPTLISLG